MKNENVIRLVAVAPIRKGACTGCFFDPLLTETCPPCSPQERKDRGSRIWVEDTDSGVAKLEELGALVSTGKLVLGGDPAAVLRAGEIVDDLYR